MVKKPKKGILVILLIVVGFATAILGTQASEETKFTISSHDDLVRGEEVTFTISGQSVEEFSSLILNIEYDTSVLEFENDYSFHLDSGPMTGLRNDVEGLLNLYVVSGSDAYISMNDGALIDITFKVKEDAKAGSHVISLTAPAESYVKIHGTEQEVLLISTESGTYFVNVPLDSVDIAKKTYNMTKGSSETILVSYSPSDTTVAANYSFVSNDTSIVTVDDNGELTAVGNGSTTITVSAYGSEFTLNVNVTTPITAVNFEKTGTQKVDVGSEITNVATVSPSDTTDDKTITYTSSNPDCATVDEHGTVTGVAPGKTTITATASNGVLNTYEVEVVISLQNVSLESSEFELTRGETKTLNVIYTPTNTTENKTVTWESSDPSIVSVSTSGEITGLKGGKGVTITGTLENGMKVTAKVDVIVPLEDIIVSDSSLEMLPGQEKKVDVTIAPSDTTDDTTVTWSSDNSDVVTVENGVIKAVKSGSTTVHVTVGTITKDISVHVLIPIDTVYPSQDSIAMNKGEETTVSVLVYPEDAEEDRDVTWKSSDTSVVTIDESGKIVALKGGNAIITGTLENGKSVEISVSVVVPLTSITIQSENLVLNRGEEKKIEATKNPSDTTDTNTIVWNSSNPDAVTIQNGVLRAVGPGTSVITASIGEIKDEITVEVLVPVESISLNATNLSLNRGETFDIVATRNPSDTTDQTAITWKSSDTSVATVDQNGHVVAIGSGDATITASIKDVTATLQVHVSVPITNFEAVEENVSVIRGQTTYLETTITPLDTTEDTTITWKSQDEKIATVNEQGVVTGVMGGSTVITGTLKNGMSIEVMVTVKTIEVQDLFFDADEITINIGKTGSQELIINPTDATELDDLTWTSSNEEVATVNEDGVVTALKKGETVITATIKNVTASYKVVVKEVPLESISINKPISSMNVGDQFQLEITKNPSDTTDDVTFTFASSDSSVLMVDENGLVTAVGAGSASITVTASNGVVTTMDVTIEEIVSPETGVASVSSYVIAALISFLGVCFALYKRVKLN